MVWFFYTLSAMILGWHIYSLWQVYQMWPRIPGAKSPISLKELIASIMIFSTQWRSGREGSKSLVVHMKDNFGDHQLAATLDLIVGGGWSKTDRLDSVKISFAQDVADLNRTVEDIRRHGAHAPLASLGGVIAGLTYIVSHLGSPEVLTHFQVGFFFSLGFIVYGLLLSLTLFVPLRARIERRAEAMTQRQAVYAELLNWLPQNPNPVFLCERLNAVVPEHERWQWMELVETHKELAA